MSFVGFAFDVAIVLRRVEKYLKSENAYGLSLSQKNYALGLWRRHEERRWHFGSRFLGGVLLLYAVYCCWQECRR